MERWEAAARALADKAVQGESSATEEQAQTVDDSKTEELAATDAEERAFGSGEQNPQEAEPSKRGGGTDKYQAPKEADAEKTIYAEQELENLYRRFNEQQKQLFAIREEMRQLLGGTSMEDYKKADAERRAKADELIAQHNEIRQSISHNDLKALSIYLWRRLGKLMKEVDEMEGDMPRTLGDELNRLSNDHNSVTRALRDHYGDSNLYHVGVKAEAERTDKADANSVSNIGEQVQSAEAEVNTNPTGKQKEVSDNNINGFEEYINSIEVTDAPFPKNIKDVIEKRQKGGKHADAARVRVGFVGNDLYISLRGRKDEIVIKNATSYGANDIELRLEYVGTTSDAARLAQDAVMELYKKRGLSIRSLYNNNPNKWLRPAFNQNQNQNQNQNLHKADAQTVPNPSDTGRVREQRGVFLSVEETRKEGIEYFRRADKNGGLRLATDEKRNVDDPDAVETKMYVPVYTVSYFGDVNSSSDPRVREYDTVDEALANMRYDYELSDRDPYSQLEVKFKEVWVDKDGDVIEEDDEPHSLYDIAREVKLPDEMQQYEGEDSIILHDETFTTGKESNEEKEEEIRDKIEKVLRKETYVLDGKEVHLKVGSLGKYTDIEVLDADGESMGSFTLRIADHSYNPRNNTTAQLAGNFISVVVNYDDPTAEKFHGRYNIHAGIDDSADSVADEVNERVQEIIDEWDADKEHPRYSLVTPESEMTVQEQEAALRDALVGKLQDAGIEVVTDSEQAQRVINEANGEARLQASLGGLKKASDFILSFLKGGTRQRSSKFEIPERANRLAEKAIGHKINSHTINANELTHAKKRHGVNGSANTENSIPLRDEDFSLMPYIMSAPTRVVKGSMSSNGTESVRYEKDLSNGVVIVVERDGRFDVSDMENITMWAQKKSATNVTVAPRASHSTSETIVISEADAAKIRKDAEDAIRNDEKLRKQKVNGNADVEAMDREYLEAVERGDKAKAQQMVEDYASRNGYNLQNGFYVKSDFDEQKPRRFDLNAYEFGRFLHDKYNGEEIDYRNEDYEYEYQEFGNLSLNDIFSASRMAQYYFECGARGLTLPEHVFARRIGLVPEGQRSFNYRDEVYEDGVSVLGLYDESGFIEQNNGTYRIFNDGKEYVVEGFYGGLNGSDGEPLLTHARVLGDNHSIIKSSDAVTYDDKGNVIPLSERFNSRKSDVRYFRTPGGDAYGFTVGGRIYVDTRIATAETPIHEYSHLWATALRQTNPAEWQNVMELMKGTGIWDSVRAGYPELTSDDEIADEVLAHYSGRRGAERLREAQREALAGDGVMTAKLAAMEGIRRVREALERFWRGVADFLGIHFTTAEEVADKVLSDLLHGVKPGGADSSVRFEENAEMADIVARAKADGTYLKAPNGKPSNLSPRQWAQVRTKAFKDWFGNWELAQKVLNIVAAAKEHGFKNFADAKAWANDNIVRTLTNEETGGKGEIRISNNAVSKFLSESAVAKSESKDVHLSVLKVLPDVIRESVDAEQHPDYKKGADGNRSAENGVNENVTIHRLYGAVEIDGKTYRVKVTLKEYTDSNRPQKAYSYEATKIELLAGTLVGGKTSNPSTNNSISTAKLLENIESSKGKGEKLLDCSKVVDENGEPLVVYHQTSNDFTVFNTNNERAGKYDNETPTGIFFKTSDRRIRVEGSKQMHCFIKADDVLTFVDRNEISAYWKDNVVGYGYLQSKIDEINRKYKTESERLEAQNDELYKENYKDIAAGNLSEAKSKDLSEVEEKLENIYAEWDNQLNQLMRKQKDLITAYVNANKIEGIHLLNDENVDTYIVFEPTQIKSATDNVGTFDSSNPDIRYQFIGEKGARAMDMAEEAFVRLDNLQVARDMDLSGKDAKTIKLATGWEFGADGKWRYEIGDGKFDAFGNLHPERRKLSEEELKFIKETSDEFDRAFDRGLELTDSDRAVDVCVAGGMERSKAERIVYLNEKSLRLSSDPKMLDDYLDNDDLFAAYPELRKIRVIEGNARGILAGVRGVYNPVGRTLLLYDMSRDTLLHEVQHAIQHIEGFATGGSHNTVRQRIEDLINENRNASEYAKSKLRLYADAKINEFFLEGSYDTLIKSDDPLIRRHAIEKYWDAMNFIDNDDRSSLVNEYPDLSPDEIALSGYHVKEAVEELRRLAKSYKDDIPEGNMDALNLVQKLERLLQEKNDKELYAALGGEVESRNVQKRLGMTEEARRASLASETEDVAREDQIILFDGLGVMPWDASLSGSSVLEAVNKRFNEELQQQIDGTLPKGHVYQLGMPGAVLRAAGFPNAPIELSSTRLAEKAGQRNHQFDISDIKSLPKALSEPMAVFRYGDKSKAENVIVSIERDGKQFVVGVHFNQGRHGIIVSDVRGLFNKNNAEWLNWISQGKAEYLDKEKIQVLIDKQRTNLAEVEYLNLEDVAKVVENFVNPSVGDEKDGNISEDTAVYRIREDAPPAKTGVGYKVFVLKNGKLYPPMVANPGGEATPVGVWLDADAAPVAGMTKTGRQQVKAGGKGTQGGSGKLAYRPGWHLGEIPYALQFNRLNPETGQRELFPADFVWAEVEYADDVNYQEEAMSYGMNANGKFQHSLAGLPRLPKNGSYKYRTNPDPNTDAWVITGAMKVNRILKPSEVDAMVEAAGREPQRRQNDAVTDEQIDALNREIEGTMKKDASMKRKTAEQMGARLHTPVNIIETAESVTHPDPEEQARRRNAKGWYDPASGQVNIVIGNNANVDDVAATVFHEVVAHKGLREMIGRERYDEFLDEIYDHLRAATKKAVDADAARRFANEPLRGYKQHRRVAMDELLGRLAEKGFEDFTAEEQGIWERLKEKVIEAINGFLGALKLPKWVRLGDNELRYILWRSHEQMRSRDGEVDAVRDEAKREALGLEPTQEDILLRTKGNKEYNGNNVLWDNNLSIYDNLMAYVMREAESVNGEAAAASRGKMREALLSAVVTVRFVRR